MIEKNTLLKKTITYDLETVEQMNNTKMGTNSRRGDPQPWVPQWARLLLLSCAMLIINVNSSVQELVDGNHENIYKN